MSKKCYIDTNIILRIILNDKKQLTKKIVSFLKSNKKLNLILPSVVIFEAFQVLTGQRLAYSPAQATLFLSQLILSLEKHITVEDQAEHLEACLIINRRSIDYIDAFLYAQAINSGGQVLSFDKDFDKLDNKIRLSP